MPTVTHTLIEKLRTESSLAQADLTAVLRRTYYKGIDDRQFASEETVEDVQDHAFRRYERTLCHYIPWVMNAFDLSGKDLIEIGCGTGSSTAAFAPFCRHLHAYEIAGPAAETAQARIQLLGIRNVSILTTEPENLLDTLAESHGSDVAAILLFAVLEHMTIEERLTTLTRCWDILSSDGVLIIAETPNRLTYHDYHTSWLPFFHMLPSELAFKYYHKSPRINFTTDIDRHLAASGIDGARMALVRWGNGVSYHEFELALGPDLARLLIADGDAEEMRRLYPVSNVEKLLRQYFIDARVDVPLAFTNQIFNLIFQKKPGQ